MIDFIEQFVSECTPSPRWDGLPMLHLTRIVSFEHWYETLFQHAFFLQKASKFVDRNDCVGLCSGKLSVAAARKHLTGGHSELHVSDAVAEGFGDRAASILNDRIAKRNFVDFAYWILCASDACSATQESERIAWNEYAPNHTGVQFHFKFPQIQRQYCCVKPVEYVEELPKINLGNVSDDLIFDNEYNLFFDRCIFSKLAVKYSWEHEYRFLIDDRATICNCDYVQILHKRLSHDDKMHPYLRIPPSMITKVVFGSGIPIKSYVAQIKDFKKKLSFRHITFCQQAATSNGTFEYRKL